MCVVLSPVQSEDLTSGEIKTNILHEISELFPPQQIPDGALDPRREVVRRKIVLYHNFFRTKVRPSASNMLLMVNLSLTTNVSPRLYPH